MGDPYPSESERAASLEVRAASLELIERALETLPVPVFLKGKDGRILFVNSALIQQAGEPGEHFLGKTIYDFAPREEAGTLDREDERVQSGERLTSERTVTVGNREIQYVVTRECLTGTPLSDVMVGCIYDFNAQARIQADLARERDFISAVLQASGGLVLVIDTAGRIVQCNRACEQVTGYSGAELKGRLLWDVFVHPDGHAASQARLRTLIATRAPSFFENEWITKSGEPRRISFSTTVLTSDDGQVRNVVGTGIDTTEHYQAQQNLLKSEIQFRSIWEASSEPMCLGDERGIVLRVNNAFARMVGLPGATLQGADIIDLFRREEQAAVRAWYAAEFAARGAESRLERELHFADGRSGTFDISLTVLEIPGQPAQMLSVYHDVTERKRTSERARILISAKTEFLANMSHEIRTPLNAILGMTGLALNTQLESETREYLELVKYSSQALLEMVNDVLDYSKYETGRMLLASSEFSLRGALREALQPIAARASARDLQFEYSVPEDLPDNLIGDEQRLRQILVNLAGNAVKFTPAGSVEIGVRAESIDGSAIRLHFTVADTGIGIALERHAHIFEPFTQVDGSTTRKYGGTGLGLSIGALLVELMGGRIWLESEPGQGSIFHFTVALEIAQPAQPGCNKYQEVFR